jgi:hypothetical protein
MDVEEVLSELVSYAHEHGWDLTTHEAIRTVRPCFDKASEGLGSKETVEYAVRKMAYSSLCQEFTYYYYLGEHKIWHKHKDYLGHVTESMVSISPPVVSHIMQRNKLDTACLVILNADANIAFMDAKTLFEEIGPGRLVRLRRLGTLMQKLNVPLNKFTTEDPYPDHRIKYAE